MTKESLQRIFTTALLVIVLAGGLVYQRSQAQTPGQAQTQQQGEFVRHVTVSGTGFVTGTPDQAVVVVGVQTDADTAGQALNQNNQQMEALLNALQQEGIQEQDIQTQTVQLWPRYGDTGGEPGTSPQVVGYTAMNTVEVRVRDLDNLGNVLDSVVQAGGNVIQNIRFEIGEDDGMLGTARQNAMADARQKAEQLADLANAELGPVISIRETGFGGPQPFGMGGAAEAAAVPIQPGTQNVQVQLEVTWELDVSGLPDTGLPGTATPTTLTPQPTERANTPTPFTGNTPTPLLTTPSDGDDTPTPDLMDTPEATPSGTETPDTTPGG